jgi:heat shock protein HtpX
MTDLSNFTASAADWRKQLQINERRTKVVIGIFIAIYLFVGLLIDLYIHPELNTLPFVTAIMQLIDLKVFPAATLIAGAVAAISIFITFMLYDRIVLMGTEYREVNPGSIKSLTEQQLYNIVEELRIAAGLHYTPKVYIINAAYMNAFASGYSEKSALIAITSGLLEKLDRSELQAVIAHELSHIRHHDIKLTLVATVLSNLMLIAIDFLFYNMIFGGEKRRRSNDENNGGGNFLVIIIILLRYILPIVTALLMLYLSRTREYMADAGSVELTRDNTPLGRALLKISGDHQENREAYTALYSSTRNEDVRRAAYIFDPGDAGVKIKQSMATMFSTHPSIQDRLKALGFKSKN